MPIFNAFPRKIIIANEAKTRVVSVEYPQDMQFGELLDKIIEVKVAIEEELERLKEVKKEKEEKTPQE
jgi:hypothetical protein